MKRAKRQNAGCNPVFDDPSAITVTDDECDPVEQRFVTQRVGAVGRLLVVVYTWRAETSPHPAKPREREGGYFACMQRFYDQHSLEKSE